ncbi:MAG: hypothetical protein ACE5LA_07955, partial [Dehalococcoidales bacterium]
MSQGLVMKAILNKKLLKRLIAIIGISALVWLVFLMETGISHEKKTPSLECFSCHGPHPPRSAEETDLANFAISPHARGPELTCSHCHEYPEEVEELDPNGCTGCHRRGGYPIKTVLEALIKAGHP